MNAQRPTPLIETSIAFLKGVDETGWHNLVAIHPNGSQHGIIGKTFAPGSWGDIKTWLLSNAAWNIYYSGNEPIPGAPDRKLRKDEIGAGRVVVADLDPEGSNAAETSMSRAKLFALAMELAEGPCPPTFIVDSGNGIQLVWILREKLDPKIWRQDVENAANGVGVKLNGDSVFDFNRIMRLAGTINHSSPGKIARGLLGGRVRVLELSKPEARYTLAELAKVYPPIPVAREETDKAVAAATLEIDFDAAEAATPEQFEELYRRLKAIGPAGSYARRLLDGDASAAPDDTSGSGWRGALARLMAQNGFTAAEYAMVALHWEPGLPTNNRELTERDLARDWARIGAPAATKATEQREAALSLLGPVADEEIDTSDFPEIEHKPQKRGLERVSFAKAAELARTAGRRPLIKGLLDQGAMTVLYGDSNVGKTFVTLLLAHHIARGETFAGMRVVQSPVVYVAAEGGHGITLRIDALLRTRGDAPLFDFVLSSVDLLDPNADLEELIELLRTGAGTGLLVLDTLARIMAGGDENAFTDMSGLVRNIDRIRQETKAHVLLVHHTGKDAARGARGHSSLRAATDTEIEVSEGQITVTKQRDLPKNWSSAFAIRGVELWKDEDGDQVNSAVAELVEKREEQPRGALTSAEAQIYDALVACFEACEDPSVGVVTADIATVLEGKVNASTVRARLPSLRLKGWAETPKRGKWRPRGVSDISSGEADPSRFLSKIEEPGADEMSEQEPDEGLFD